LVISFCFCNQSPITASANHRSFEFEGDLEQHLVFPHLSILADVAVDLFHLEPGKFFQAVVGLADCRLDRRLDALRGNPDDLDLLVLRM